MANLISKIRARRTRDRERKSGQMSAAQLPLPENPYLGLLIGLVFWAAASFLMHAGYWLGSKESVIGAGFRVTGDAAFLLAGILATAIYLNTVQPGFLRRNSRIALLALITLLPLALSKAAYRLFQVSGWIPAEVTVFLLPFALAPLLATILTNSNAGIAVGVWASLGLALLAGRSFTVLVTGLIATTVAAFTARSIRTRSRVFSIGLWIGMSQLLCVFAQTALDWSEASPLLVVHQALACIAGGLFSAVVVLVVLPAFEILFGVTTDIRLLEISDLGHPLLQSLAIEAPGTYHHSLVVANLAQAAADEIGANSLLARVCAYFHDIGKLAKPEFFAENIHLRDNPHDDLPPSMSTLILASHVKEGVSLAMLHKLPGPVAAVIREHHGTGLMSVFHHKAKTQMELDLRKPDSVSSPVDESSFRYPGPKPTTRESALICLADAVEAASRSIEKNSPGHIESLVQDIVMSRFEDGQLDQCELTLSDLTRVKRSFVFTLRSMYHGRVSYPKDENRDKQPAKDGAAEPAEGRSADKTSHAQG